MDQIELRIRQFSGTKKHKLPRSGLSLCVNNQQSTELGCPGMADHKTLSPQVSLSIEPPSGHVQEGYSGEIYEQASLKRKKKRRKEEKRGRGKKKEEGEPGRIKQLTAREKKTIWK